MCGGDKGRMALWGAAWLTMASHSETNRGLLLKAGTKLAASMSSMAPEDAATALLVYAFFNVKNPG